MRLELTKRADYAIRTVLALARAADDERLSVRRVAADQRVPERFLPQVMRDLVRAGRPRAAENTSTTPRSSCSNRSALLRQSLKSPAMR